MLVISPLTWKVRRVAYQSRSVILKLWEIHPRIGFTGGTVVKNLPANAENSRDTGSIPGSGRFPGVGDGNPLQYSCLENSMDRGAWWAIVNRVTKSGTQLSELSWAESVSMTNELKILDIITLNTNLELCNLILSGSQFLFCKMASTCQISHVTRVCEN